MSNIQIAGMDQLLGRLQNLPSNVTAAIATEIQDGAQAIAAEAKQRAPGDQGFLRNLIAAIKDDPTTWRVVSGAEYSAFVEFGTLTKVSVPAGLEEYAAQFKGDFASCTYSEGGNLTAWEAISAWCERHGIEKEAWYAIYLTVIKVGVKPQPFFFPAVLRQEPIILQRIKQAIQDAL